MKKIFGFAIVCGMFSAAASAAVTSCGAGYVLASHANIDGIKAAECQKLWCRDLENGKTMGNGKTAASGYKTTSGPIELCDANNNCIECFGDRSWCSGEPVGEWNPEYGAYTRNGDSATFESYQRGNCFAWRLIEKPDCDDGYTAVLKNGEWICASVSNPGGAAATINKASSVRRTGTLRRGLK